jgi:catechol-2,3-dioxygenase
VLSDHPVIPILLSTDMPASRTFYHDTLGLAILAEDEERIVLRCGGGTQLVISRSTIGTADTQTQMAWRVPDLRAALADMGYSWAASFIDPSRNVLEFVQPKV